MGAPGDPSDRDDQPRTLGGVLYADKAKARVQEQDWARLVQCIAGGDQVALHTLFARSHRIVFTLIMRITNNRDTAEEVTLDVFHDVWRRASTYVATNGSVVGWIMNQARSRAIDRLRYEQRKKRVGDPAESLPPPAAAPDPHEAFDVMEQRRFLDEALRDLAPGEREAIETAFFSELSYVEAAVRLNQPVGTVKTRIRSGLRKLRQALDGKVTGS